MSHFKIWQIFLHLRFKTCAFLKKKIKQKLKHQRVISGSFCKKENIKIITFTAFDTMEIKVFQCSRNRLVNHFFFALLLHHLFNYKHL